MTDKELNSHDLAREIEIVKLQEENEELKSLLRGTTHCFDEEEHNKLKEENQELKKQFEKRTKMYQNAYDYSQKMEGKAIILETQQKKFIKYLEDEIKRINPKNLDIGELNLRLDDIKFIQYLIYEEILQKYKSIIGVSDENSKN